ncbi:MAG: MnhB domain-containing protein [Bacillota bacterium]
MNDMVVQIITRILIPFIEVFAVYVIFHGHISPGGSFSGGAILGASFVLATLVFGTARFNRKFGHMVSQLVESVGGSWYILVGLFGILAGANFLTNKLAGFGMGRPGYLFSAGAIPVITIGLGLKVGSTMVTLFHGLIEEEENHGDH